MGSGITQVAAIDGYVAVPRDVERTFVGSSLNRIEENLARSVKSDDLVESEAATALERVRGTTELSDLAATNFVIRTASEEMERKRDIFVDLDAITGTDTVLASNTLTLSVTTIASATDRSKMVVGLHFMNFVPVMDGVKVVVVARTTLDVTRFAHELSDRFGKETWEADDKPGSVSNRILMPWINDGICAYDEGVATKRTSITG